MVCLILSACAIAEEPDETRITVDGQVDDWAGRDVILEDPAGDGEEGCLDRRPFTLSATGTRCISWPNLTIPCCG